MFGLCAIITLIVELILALKFFPRSNYPRTFFPKGSTLYFLTI